MSKLVSILIQALTTMQITRSCVKRFLLDLGILSSMAAFIWPRLARYHSSNSTPRQNHLQRSICSMLHSRFSNGRISKGDRLYLLNAHLTSRLSNIFSETVVKFPLHFPLLLWKLIDARGLSGQCLQKSWTVSSV